MTIRWSRVVAVAAVLALAAPLPGCDKKSDDTEEDDDDNDDNDDSDKKKEEKKDDDKDDGNPMAGATYKTVPQTQVQVPIPPGWKTKKVSLYSMAAAPDGKAFVAFTTVSSKGEFVGRIQHVQKTFKVTEYQKKKDVESKIGPDQLPAFIQDATCKFNGHPAIMSSVLINAGSRHLVFVVYALAQNAPDKTKKQALATVLQMRKKR